MSLTERIDNDYVQAYKAKDALRLSVLRMVKTAAKNRLVELRRPGGALEDGEMLDVFIREAKQRQDSIEQYTTAGRPDLAAKEEAELTILREYLPRALSPEELGAAIDAAVAELGATGTRGRQGSGGRRQAAPLLRRRHRVRGPRVPWQRRAAFPRVSRRATIARIAAGLILCGITTKACDAGS